MKENNVKFELGSISFGPGYRKFTAVRKIEIWPFFTANSNTLDDIFPVKVNSTWKTDQLLVNCNVGFCVTCSLSADGVPY